jgi:hypothetical protein
MEPNKVPGIFDKSYAETNRVDILTDRERCRNIEMIDAYKEEIDKVFSTAIRKLERYLEKSMKSIASIEEKKEEKKEINGKFSLDELVKRFGEEKIIFTDNIKDVVSNAQIQDTFKEWLVEAGVDLTEFQIQKVTQYIRKQFKWKLCPKKGENVQITVDGKRIRGLKGVRIVNTVSDSDSPI